MMMPLPGLLCAWCSSFASPSVCGIGTAPPTRSVVVRSSGHRSAPVPGEDGSRRWSRPSAAPPSALSREQLRSCPRRVRGPGPMACRPGRGKLRAWEGSPASPWNSCLRTAALPPSSAVITRRFVEVTARSMHARRERRLPGVAVSRRSWALPAPASRRSCTFWLGSTNPQVVRSRSPALGSTLSDRELTLLRRKQGRLHLPELQPAPGTRCRAEHPAPPFGSAATSPTRPGARP